MPNGMSEEAQSRGHAVWEGAPCKGALYPIEVEVRQDSGRRLKSSVPKFAVNQSSSARLKWAASSA